MKILIFILAILPSCVRAGDIETDKRPEWINQTNYYNVNYDLSPVVAMSQIDFNRCSRAWQLGLGFGRDEANAAAIGLGKKVAKDVFLKATYGHSQDRDVVGVGIMFNLD